MIIMRDTHAPSSIERLDAWPQGTYRQLRDIERSANHSPAVVTPSDDGTNRGDHAPPS